MANRDAIDDWKTVAAPYQKRLRSLAKRVASRQMSTISAGNESSDKYEFELSVDTEQVRIPDDDEDADAENKVHYWSSMDLIGEDKLKLDGVTRFFFFLCVLCAASARVYIYSLFYMANPDCTDKNRACSRHCIF